MDIDIICVGKLKEEWWRGATAEYGKRLGRFCRLRIAELKEERLPDKAGPGEEQAVIAAEGRAILAAIPAGAWVIALDVQGRQLSSEQLAAELARLQLAGKSRLCFLIGGSLGLSQAALARADLRLSFSAMTFPHQMMRPILLEQLYRACKINAHETYHK